MEDLEAAINEADKLSVIENTAAVVQPDPEMQKGIPDTESTKKSQKRSKKCYAIKYLTFENLF